MLNGISQAVSTLGRHITSAASRVSSAGLSGFSVSPQAVRLNPIRAQSPFSPGTSNINARTTFNVSSPATSFTPSRPAPPPPTSGQASGASRPLPPIAQALKIIWLPMKSRKALRLQVLSQAARPHRRRQVDRLPGHPALYRPLRRH